MKRLLATVAVLLAAACTPSTTAPTPTVTGTGELLATAAPGKPHCGYERWKVKTGTDPAAGQVVLTPVDTTVAALVAETSPLPPVTGKYPPQTPRQPQEERTVRLHATLIAYAIEQDDDLHLVLLAAGPATMIAEIPAPACVGASSPFLAGVTNARHAFVAATGYKQPEPPAGQYAPPFVQTNVSVVVTGVVFFDFVHGQRGVASNGVELHPVLDITFGTHPHHHRPRPSPTATP